MASKPRTDQERWKQVKMWRPIVIRLTRALQKMEAAGEQRVYRGRTDAFEPLTKVYVPGQLVRWAGLSSCSGVLAWT